MGPPVEFRKTPLTGWTSVHILREGTTLVFWGLTALYVLVTVFLVIEVGLRIMGEGSRYGDFVCDASCYTLAMVIFILLSLTLVRRYRELFVWSISRDMVRRLYLVERRETLAVVVEGAIRSLGWRFKRIDPPKRADDRAPFIMRDMVRMYNIEGGTLRVIVTAHRSRKHDGFESEVLVGPRVGIEEGAVDRLQRAIESGFLDREPDPRDHPPELRIVEMDP